MKKDNWIFALIAVLLLLTLMHGANAQSGPIRKKYEVKVRLKSGVLFSGILIGASQDSVVILETRKIVVGCKAKVFLTEDYFLIGEIVGMSDSTVVLKTETAANQLIRYSQIKRITAVSYPKGYNKNAPVRTSFPVHQIATLQLSSKGSGAIGFLVGGLAAAMIGYGIGHASYSKEFGGPELKGAGLATLAFPIGGLMGSAIAREGKTYKINGDPVNYERFLKKVK